MTDATRWAQRYERIMTSATWQAPHHRRDMALAAGQAPHHGRNSAAKHLVISEKWTQGGRRQRPAGCDRNDSLEDRRSPLFPQVGFCSRC